MTRKRPALSKTRKSNKSLPAKTRTKHDSLSQSEESDNVTEQAHSSSKNDPDFAASSTSELDTTTADGAEEVSTSGISENEVEKPKSPVKSRPTSEQQHLPQSSGPCTNLALLSIIVIVIAVGCFYFPKSQESPEISLTDMFKHELKLIESEMVLQDKQLWKIARVTLVKHHRNSSNNHPAVLLLAADENAYSTAQCLANKLAAAYSNKCSAPSIKVSGLTVKNLQATEAKYHLDNKLTNQFKSGACAAVVDRFDLIPAAATTLFYQFCENDNAPFKNVAIILTLQVENGDWSQSAQDLSNLPPRLWDEIVDKFLVHSLMHRDPGVMTSDMISGLLSRITPAVAWVKKIDNLNC